MTIRTSIGLGVAIVLCGWIAGDASAQDIVGDWQGTLKAGPAELRLVLHITGASPDGLKATLDSIDQNAHGIPINSISIRKSVLTFRADSIGGSYDGRLNAAGTSIAGTWTQGQSLPLDFQRMTTAPKKPAQPGKPSDIDGAWSGTLETGVGSLRVVFHITNTDQGLTATLDSPDQGANGIPMTAVKRDGSSLRIEAKPIAGEFQGQISKDLSSIAGTWTQNGQSLPLTLKRNKSGAELERRRPQNPSKPYPYREEEVSYENQAAGIRLAATLTVPTNKGPFHGVVLITGSGPQDRDESIMGHKPFLVLADYLTRKGIAVLRGDDRGVGKSGGAFAAGTTADFATDAEAGVAYLKTRAEIDPREIGLIGHSEGGVIAPMVAARNSSIAYIVMMAGTGVPGDEILAEQSLLLTEASGKSKHDAEKNAAREREILAVVKQEKDSAALDKVLREKLAGMPAAQRDSQIRQITSPWFRYFIAYDPAVALRKVTCPVLAINGEKDMQVAPKQNLPPIRKALEAGGNKDFEIDELAGLNHLFQTAKTGAPAEYAQIEETMSPVALEKIASWILKH
jgi:pimeloyl-ACP methyl ester carboxylesterase